ncbi:MAG: sigma-70 family RNA polymerase sigma factor [Chloroflexi bacterium]|nr:MAG: sigma-70 family RNA polymerase sigma factor [Chloroflexota bacterium]TME16120.1 MAG: sigma-70 family RNA polymerase sigma factor [Chloroflexota bacterium]TME18965.1 MAG: sigma-70 family RNA polymerase sigma factor [Chloroflexota bacterium]
MSARPPFEDLYREYLTRIYGYVYAQLRNSAEAEDVTAQVFMSAYKAYDRFEVRALTPSAWLFRIARNAVYDHHRRTQVRERTEHRLRAELPAGFDPAVVAEDRVLFGELLAAVRRLPDRQQEVVALRHRSDLSFKEIGDLMDCSEDAAKMLYHRALKALREMVPK